MYKMDKYVLRERYSPVPDYTILKMDDNQSFELKLSEVDTANVIAGRWEIIKSNGEETEIRFTYRDKNVFGIFRTNILYFEYPNEFHSGKYKHILYVKATE